MKLITIIIIISLLMSLFIILASFEYIHNNSVTGNNTSNDTIISTSNNTNISLTATPILDETYNKTLYIPPNDYVINNINWSSYPNLQRGYVSVSEISEPNNVVPHKFIEVQIHTEIINSDNETEILKQLDGVARDARKIYGENSGINIYGDKFGIFYYSSSMIPYDDHMY